MRKKIWKRSTVCLFIHSVKRKERKLCIFTWNLQIYFVWDATRSSSFGWNKVVSCTLTFSATELMWSEQFACGFHAYYVYRLMILLNLRWRIIQYRCHSLEFTLSIRVEWKTSSRATYKRDVLCTKWSDLIGLGVLWVTYRMVWLREVHWIALWNSIIFFSISVKFPSHT